MSIHFFQFPFHFRREDSSTFIQFNKQSEFLANVKIRNEY